MLINNVERNLEESYKAYDKITGMIDAYTEKKIDRENQAARDGLRLGRAAAS